MGGIEIGTVTTAGKNKWVNVDDLTPTGKALIRIEPGETVRVVGGAGGEGVALKVRAVILDPPGLVLVAQKKWELCT